MRRKKIPRSADNKTAASIDPHSTGSVPTSADNQRQTELSGQKGIPDLFSGISVNDAEMAETRLASLFGDFPNTANDQDTNMLPETSQPTGKGGFTRNSLVHSLGVTDPAQFISEIAEPGVTSLPDSVSKDIGDIAILRTAAGGNTDDDAPLSPNQYLVGTNGSDYLTGGSGDDGLFGLDGKDFLEGGAGADMLDGGGGDEDVAEYVGSAHRCGCQPRPRALAMAGMRPATPWSTSNIVHGSMFDDRIEGNHQINRLVGRLGDDTLLGLGGDDRLLGGYGADIIDGGDGIDTADYIWSDQGVIVDLSTGMGTGGEAEGDVLISIENLSGSNYSDMLTGDSSTNRLFGMDGDDILQGGAGDDRLTGGVGADVLDGGAGIDIADYSAADSAVFLSLATGGTSGEATGDSFTSIETVYGSAFNDTISGDDLANRLVGNAGNDSLFGAGGIDYLLGGEGNDILNGGSGADVFVFEGVFGDDIIEDMWAGASRTDRIWLKDQGVANWDELQSHIHQSGDDVVLEFDNGTITLQDMVIADLHTDDFIFG